MTEQPAHDRLNLVHPDDVEFYADDPDGRAAYESGIRMAEEVELEAALHGTCVPCAFTGFTECGVFIHCDTRP